MRLKAFMLWLFHMKHTYEVRKISGSSNRNVTGKLVYGGDKLGAAISAYDRADEALAPGEKVTLRVIVPLLETHAWPDEDLDSPEELDGPSGSDYINDQPGAVGNDPTMVVLDEAAEVPLKSWNALQEQKGHECDTRGPLVQDVETRILRTSCSVCGETSG